MKIPKEASKILKQILSAGPKGGFKNYLNSHV